MVNHVTLEAAGANRGDGTEFVSGPEQVLTRLNGTGAVYDLLETLGLVRRQAPWKAKFSEGASTACNLGSGGFAAIISDVGDS
jgi:hypothetical protein